MGVNIRLHSFLPSAAENSPAALPTVTIDQEAGCASAGLNVVVKTNMFSVL
jgi:hypothetical protein